MKLFDVGVAAGIIFLAACGHATFPTQPTPSITQASNSLFRDLERLDADVALVVIGEVMEVSQIKVTMSPDTKTHFCSYDAIVTVERTLFGPETTTVMINLYLHSIATSDGPGVVSPRRLLGEGDRVMAFLSRRSSLFDLSEGGFVSEAAFWVEGLEVVKYFVTLSMGDSGTAQCSIDQALEYVKETQPLEKVIVWVEQFSQRNMPPRSGPDSMT